MPQLYASCWGKLWPLTWSEPAAPGVPAGGWPCSLAGPVSEVVPVVVVPDGDAGELRRVLKRLRRLGFESVEVRAEVGTEVAS